MKTMAQARDYILSMDITPENVTHRVGVTRHQAAVHSHRKVAAAAATAYGKFKDEITPIKGKFIFSTDTDGKKNAWLYDTISSRVDYTAPGNSSTRMAYSIDGTRLFSCETNKDGDYYIVEWNESEEVVKHTYEGLKRSDEVVQFRLPS
ncbi:topless-related protein 4-like protein isoform X1 [Tanacetum coccineum]